MMRNDPASAKKLGDLIIKNTYRTLMTRGKKGCFVYCVDPALSHFLRSRIHESATTTRTAITELKRSTANFNESPYTLVTNEERLAGHAAVPVIDLNTATGVVTRDDELEVAAVTWAAPPDWISPKKGMFIAQVPITTSSHRVPDQLWGLFRVTSEPTSRGARLLVRNTATSEVSGFQQSFELLSFDRIADERDHAFQIIAELLTEIS